MRRGHSISVNGFRHDNLDFAGRSSGNSEPKRSSIDRAKSKAVECRGLTRVFSGQKRAAVSNVTFSVDRGEIVSLVGASGCGKTTTLRLIAGFELPDEGLIRIEGKDVARRGRGTPANNRPTGLVFQEHALFPHLTVRENIAFGLKGMTRKARNDRIDELLDLIALSDLEDRYPHQLSGGQAQRVALIRAVAPKPRVLLLDEPFNNLDVGLRFRLLHDVERLIRSERTSAIMVTHDWQEAFAIADRIAIMNEGTILQIGTPREVYEYPHSRYVAEFFGPLNELPVNDFPANAAVVAKADSSGNRKRSSDSDISTDDTDELLCIRPRDVVIATHNDEVYPNCLTYRGVVAERRFLGEYQEIRCELLNGKHPEDGRCITAYAPAHVTIGEGDAVIAACPKKWLLRFSA